MICTLTDEQYCTIDVTCTKIEDREKGAIRLGSIVQKHDQHGVYENEKMQNDGR